MDRKILLDVETTGLYPASGHKIIELACLELFNDNQTGKEFHIYINPQREIPMESTRVHGITDDQVKDCKIFAEIAEDFLNFVGDSKVIAHNAEFDRGFINFELKTIGKTELPKSSFIDTLVIARGKFPNQKVSLDELCKKFNIDLTSRKDYHGALVDIKLLAEVYYNLLKGQKNIFETEVVKQSARANSENMLQTYNFVDFPKRFFNLNEEEEQQHLSFIKAMKKSIWLEKYNN